MADGGPFFSAVSSNAHHLYILLQCIGFAPQATVQITPDGIRVSVEEGRVVQGLAFLDKALFTSYTFNQPTETNNENGDNDDSTYYPHFVISLAALLETLKIFGINDSSGSGPSKANPTTSSAFSAPALLLDRSCTLQYFQHGSPLSVTLNEAGVKTVCELTTYESDDNEVDIPLQRDAIIMKIIMRSAWLHNAITELDATDPTTLRVSASATKAPFFVLSGSGGPFSESVVEFSIDQQDTNQDSSAQHQLQHTHHKVLADDGTSRSRAKRAKLAPTVTETFLVSPPSAMGPRVIQDYRFPLIRKAARAMGVANKVSIRGDRQGVLSLQFMIELDESGSRLVRESTGGGGGNGVVTFIDFRFVPLLDENEGEAELREEDYHV